MHGPWHFTLEIVQRSPGRSSVNMLGHVAQLHASNALQLATWLSVLLDVGQCPKPLFSKACSQCHYTLMVCR